MWMPGLEVIEGNDAAVHWPEREVSMFSTANIVGLVEHNRACKGVLDTLQQKIEKNFSTWQRLMNGADSAKIVNEGGSCQPGLVNCFQKEQV